MNKETTQTEEWGNIELPGLSDEELFRKKWNQVAALKGRKRPDHSEFMKTANPMQGKEHPNKGKLMPKTSDKLKGKAKPEGFGQLISNIKKGKPLPSMQGRKRPEQHYIMKDPKRNRGADSMKQGIICPHCSKEANGPNYHRWHGNNCKQRNL